MKKSFVLLALQVVLFEPVVLLVFAGHVNSALIGLVILFVELLVIPTTLWKEFGNANESISNWFIGKYDKLSTKK